MDLPVSVQTFSLPRKLPGVTSHVDSDPETLMSSCGFCTLGDLASSLAFSKPRDLLMPRGEEAQLALDVDSEQPLVELCCMSLTPFPFHQLVWPPARLEKIGHPPPPPCAPTEKTGP